MCPKKKKIRACSWSLGLYHEHESAVLNCTAGEETGPPASRAGRKTPHCLAGFATSLVHCIRSWYLPEGVGNPWCRSSSFPQVCIFLTPLPNTDRLQGQKIHLTIVMYESLYLKETKMKANKVKIHLQYSDSLWTFYIPWQLKAVHIVWLIYALCNKCTG